MHYSFKNALIDYFEQKGVPVPPANSRSGVGTPCWLAGRRCCRSQDATFLTIFLLQKLYAPFFCCPCQNSSANLLFNLQKLCIMLIFLLLSIFQRFYQQHESSIPPPEEDQRGFPHQWEVREANVLTNMLMFIVSIARCYRHH